MRRLALGLPTALQVHRNYAILFHGHGVSQFSYLENPLAYAALRLSTAAHSLQPTGKVPTQSANFGTYTTSSGHPSGIWLFMHLTHYGSLVVNEVRMLDPNHLLHTFMSPRFNDASEYLLVM